MQRRIAVLECHRVGMKSTTPIVCGFKIWCDTGCRNFPTDIRYRRLDPHGNIQVKVYGHRGWIKEKDWMDDREAWNSIEDWEPDREDTIPCATRATGDTKSKNVSADMGSDKNVTKNESSHDPVNHPPHYCTGGIECIDAIKAAVSVPGMTAYQGYLAGNVMKYLWRHQLKGNPLQDVEKAEFYLNRLKESYTVVNGGSAK